MADNVTAGVEECEPEDAGNGATEVLECGFADGTLTLTTFETAEVFGAHRGTRIGLDPGSRYSNTPAGVVYSIDATADFAEAEASSLYWDSPEALQSGQYVASTGTVAVDRLAKMFDRVAAAVVYPTKPEDRGMIALAESFLNVDTCDRIQTNVAGELEESYCPAPDGIDVWIVVFETTKDFKAFRDLRVGVGGPRWRAVLLELRERHPRDPGGLRELRERGALLGPTRVQVFDGGLPRLRGPGGPHELVARPVPLVGGAEPAKPTEIQGTPLPL